ncbi:UNVERIFIED_CONTAM: hypothetical protein HDU68_008362 [Siphonaria sp. JEL0065]|nr:hypothetical protein HDU68_008362 [Siphonaria sp. JEL0065]
MSTSYNPQSGKGRKRMADAPANANDRTLQNREAQRALRERKAAYVSELEAKVKEGDELRRRIVELETEVAVLRRLTLPNNGPGAVIAYQTNPIGSCPLCAAERLKTSICMDQIAALEAQISHMRSEGEALKTQTLMSMVCCANANCIYTGGDGGLSRVSQETPPDPMDSIPRTVETSISRCSSSQQTQSCCSSPSKQCTSQSQACSSSKLCSNQTQTPTIQKSRCCSASGTCSSASTNSHARNIAPSSSADALLSTCSPVPATPTPSDTSTIRFATSQELYGPMEIESTIIALKQIPSLVNSPAVDEMCALLVQHSCIGDSKTARRHLIKMARTTVKVFDSCTIVDRMKAVEIFSLFQQRNANHVKYFDQFLVSTRPRVRAQKTTPDPPRLKNLKDSMISIPSLSDARDLVGEFCDVLWKDQGIPTEDEDGENFFVIRELQAKLEEKCSVEDRTRFWVLFEAVREGKRKEMDALINRVEASDNLNE